jgi:ribonuclease HI
MNYVVFTDGAYDESSEKGSSAFFIKRNDDEFVDMKCYVLSSRNNRYAELFAYSSAAEYLLENCNITSEDKILFVSDSRSAITLASQLINGYEGDFLHPDIKFELTKKSLRELDKRAHVSFKRILGHQEEFSGNKVVDRLAKYSLRVALGR